jgi:hypothetical protein
VDASTPLAVTSESHLRMVLLAPPEAEVPPDFQAVDYNPHRHFELIAEMQRLRGTVYVADGAIQDRQLSRDRRHRQAIDEDSWHLLLVDSSGAVCGCVRYFSHPNSACFRELWVRNSAIANCPMWGRAFRAAVEAEFRQARSRNFSYVEVGGWAIAPERRCSIDALRSALATYTLARALGGCLGITTATVRHHSSSILRRIGGASLRSPQGEIPPYYDPQYQCEMEVLRFDSSAPAPKYASMVDRLYSEILSVPVISQRRPRPVWVSVPAGERTRYFDHEPVLQGI